MKKVYKKKIYNIIKEKKKKKFCYFKKNNIKYIDYKNPIFLKGFLNEFGKILPRKITKVSSKYQKKIKKAIKRCRYLGLLPYITNNINL